MVVEGFLKNGLVFLILMDLVVPYMFYSNIVDNHLSFAYLLPIIHALNLKMPTSLVHSALFPPVIAG